MDAQSEAACQLTDVPFTMQQGGHVPATGTGASIGNIGTVSGSHNPTIVGSSAVNVTTNYNYQMEGPGVHAPRLQQSQRPDQRPRAPSCQEAGNKTRDILKRVYATTGSYVQLLPGVDNDQMHIAGIYTKVQLETREGIAVTGQKGETVNSTEYAKIFRLMTKMGELIKRLIFFGMGGVGKSTIFDKIAYDWADEASEILKQFKLVFLLKMCALLQESDVVDSAFDQLLGEDSGIAKDELDKFILANPNEVLILLDGFDEMRTKKLNAASFGSVLKALNRTRYRECFICVSTRPSRLETLMSKSLVQNPCTHVEVLGFSDEDVHEYVQKFYDKDPDNGNALSQTIQKSNTLREFAKTPMLLLLMCLLWRDNEKLPETISRLFTETVDHMFTRKFVSGDDGLKTMISIGQTALRGLLSANQKFSFQDEEFEPKALDLALKAGILTKQRVMKNHKSHRNIQFMHKTMQEYCAAKNLQSLHMSNQGLLKWILNTALFRTLFENKLDQLCHTIEGVVSNEFLFRFCCGDSEKCMTDIVNLLDSKFNKYEPKYQSQVVQAIIRNCFYESQSSKAPSCLTSDSHIPSTIKIDNNNDFRSLVYLLEIVCRSDSRTAQLARVETIEVSSVSSIRDLAFALGYMENLRNLRLYSCPVVEGDLEKTLSSLKCNPLLTDLCLKCGHTSLGSRAVEWAPHIKHLTNLNKLEISDSNLQITDIERIALSVSDMPNLTDLILAGNTALGRSDDLWVNTLSRFTNIQTLNLSNCLLEWTDIEHIAAVIGDMPRLTHLILTDNPALGEWTEMWSRYLFRVKQKHTLDLSNFSLTWEDFNPISVVLDHLPTLTNVILSGNKALGESTELGVKYLLRFKNVEKLNMSHCAFQWEDIEHLASVIGDMPRLTDLILNDNPALGASTEKWSNYLLRVKKPNTLDMSNLSLTRKDFGAISVVLHHIPALTNLILVGNGLGESADMWPKELSKMTNLHSLDLTMCELKPLDIKHIASAFLDMPILTVLILAYNLALGGSSELWAKELPKMTHLNRLDLTRCDLTLLDIKHIALALLDMPRLTVLILAYNLALGGSSEWWAKELPKMTHLNRLDLMWCNLTPSDIKHIASAVRDMPKLTDLTLCGIKQLDTSAELWAKELPKMTHLNRLDLEWCNLRASDIEHIASAVRGMPRLTDLTFGSNCDLGGSAGLWAKELPKMTNLHSLDLSCCNLTASDIKHIALAVLHLPKLTDLTLGGNLALGRSPDLWAKELPKMTHLHSLDLTWCNLTASGIKYIASALLDMPRLTDLILARNPVLGGVAELWAKELPKMTHLNRLDLRWCDLTPSDMSHIALAVHDMPRLTNLTRLGGHCWELDGLHDYD